MKLTEARGHYEAFSSLASGVARNAAYAGIAIVWIFKVDNNTGMSLPEEILIPAFMFIIALSFDLLHYVFAALFWGVFNRYKEYTKGIDFSGDIEAPVWINAPAIIFFWSKLVFVILGYIQLLLYVRNSIFFQ